MTEMSISRAHAYVGLGSNLGDRAGNLLLGVRGMLDAGLRVARLSSVYETAPVGTDREQPLYLNMVAELDILGEASPAPEQLLARLLRIEYALGRRRQLEDEAAAAAPRTLDLDLLLYGDARSDTEFLTLPHPRLHLRRFVLTPLAEIAPSTSHPILGKTFRQLLTETDDRAAVSLWRPLGRTGAGS